MLPSNDTTIDKIIAKVDMDGDGAISFGEFLSMVFKSANVQAPHRRRHDHDHRRHHFNQSTQSLGLGRVISSTIDASGHSTFTAQTEDPQLLSRPNDEKRLLSTTLKTERGSAVIPTVQDDDGDKPSDNRITGDGTITKQDLKPKPIPKSKLDEFEFHKKKEDAHDDDEEQKKQPKAAPKHVMEEIQAAHRETNPELKAKLEAHLHLRPPTDDEIQQDHRSRYLTTRPDNKYWEEATEEELQAKPLPANLLGELQLAQTDLTKVLHKDRVHVPEIALKVPDIPFLNELKEAQQDLSKILHVVPEEEKNRKPLKKPRKYIDELRKAQATILKEWREETYNYWI